MRGATSPRLLLELMCAQVLLTAAATDGNPCSPAWNGWSGRAGEALSRRHPRARRTPVKTMMPNGPDVRAQRKGKQPEPTRSAAPGP